MVLLVRQTFPALEIEHNREDGRAVAKPKQDRILEHASDEILLRPSLDLDVNQDNLRLALMGFEPSDHIDSRKSLKNFSRSALESWSCPIAFSQ